MITMFKYESISVIRIVFIFQLIINSSIVFSKEFIPGSCTDDFTVHLENRIPSLMDDYDIPGAIIALVEDGKLAWTNAWGYANISIGRKMETSNVCRLESLSKSATAWGVMKLVQQGMIDLDTPVSNYLKTWKLPDSEFDNGLVTIRMLLSNSSGMSLGTIGEIYTPGESMPGLEESLTRDARIMQEPGKNFSYSNAGFNLLELLIQEVTGREFSSYMREEILDPLGMVHSGYEWQEDFDSLVPNGYGTKGQPVPVYVYPNKGAGGLFSTVEDMALFISAGMTSTPGNKNPVLSDEMIREMYSEQVNIGGFYGLAFPSYGLGHFVEKLPVGLTAVSHGGQGTGWMTHFHSVPETGDGIVIITNSQRSWPFFAYVLRDWADWNGFGKVGMSRIIPAKKAIWVIIGILFMISAWMIAKTTRWIISGVSHFAILRTKTRTSQLTKYGIFLSLTAVLLWASMQDYLFITSVFPVAAVCLEYSICLLAVVLLFSGLFDGERN